MSVGKLLISQLIKYFMCTEKNCHVVNLLVVYCTAEIK